MFSVAHMIPYGGRFEFFCKAVGDRPLNVLDVGNLGDGESTNMIGKEYVESKGGTYTGLDSNEPLTKKLNLPNQVVGDINSTEFLDETFDLVYLGEVIEHTWDPARMIKECKRILKPDGRLVLDTPNVYALNSLLRYFYKRTDWMGDERKLLYHEAKSAFQQLKEQDEVLLQPQHKIFFTPAMLRQLCHMYGMEIESIGCTIKARNPLTKLFLHFFPHFGRHLCIIARKASLEEIFQDIL